MCSGISSSIERTFLGFSQQRLSLDTTSMFGLLTFLADGINLLFSITLTDQLGFEIIF